jgi:hypothetical protein
MTERRTSLTNVIYQTFKKFKESFYYVFQLGRKVNTFKICFDGGESFLYMCYYLDGRKKEANIRTLHNNKLKLILHYHTHTYINISVHGLHACIHTYIRMYQETHIQY